MLTRAEANEPISIAAVDEALLARLALLAVQCRSHSHLVARLELRHFRANCLYPPAKLMAKRNRNSVARQWMRSKWTQISTSDVLVQVRATDATPGKFQLDFMIPYRWDWDVIDAHVPFIVEAQAAHRVCVLCHSSGEKSERESLR